MTLSEQWDKTHLSTLSDVTYYDHHLVSNQLRALVGKNVIHYFSSLNEVLVRWNNKWVSFDEYNKVFKVL